MCPSESHTLGHPFHVWVIEDERDVRETLVALIDDSNDIKCTAAFERCEPALDQLDAGVDAPDVITLDLHLPGMSGLDAIPRFKELCPSTQILIFTGYPGELNIADGVREHVAGFLSKTGHPAKILEAIRSATQGMMVMDEVLTENLVRLLSSVNVDTKTLFTKREDEVSKFLRDGLTIPQIAERLNISRSTARKERDRIYHKLNVHNRVQLVRKLTDKDSK